MKTDWDVIVAGAGPAGAMAAMRLAAAGVDVLVLDKARFPRDKPCGGGLTPKAFRQLDFDIGDLVLHRANQLYLKGPHLAPTAIETPSEAVWMVNRREFDARLGQVARERGATVREGEGVIKIETGDPSARYASGQALARVETDRGAYRARVVVGADGAESIVARQVGLRADRNRRYTAFALEAETRVARDVLDGALVDYRMPLGYGWIFPKGEAMVRPLCDALHRAKDAPSQHRRRERRPAIDSQFARAPGQVHRRKESADRGTGARDGASHSRVEP